MALAPEQGFQNFSAPNSRVFHFPFMAPTPATFDLNFASSGSAPAPFQTKICYQLFIFVHR